MVQGLAETEFIVFIASCTVLSFGFVTNLITHQLFGYCCAVLAWHQDFLFSCSALPASRPAVGKKLEGNTTRIAEPD